MTGSKTRIAQTHTHIFVPIKKETFEHHDENPSN